MDVKPSSIDIIFKVIVIAFLADFSFAFWKIADNLAALKH